jgi:hypothetical protein
VYWLVWRLLTDIEKQDAAYKNPDNDPRGVWKPSDLTRAEQRTLLVLCTAFRVRADQFPNLAVKKIPKAVLSRCEYGHDDYSLQVENLPQAPPEPGQQPLFDED